MKESRLQHYLDFIGFSMETEGYRMTALAEQYIQQVLAKELSGDEAVSEIVDRYGLSSESDTTRTADGCYEGTDIYINYFGLRDQELLDEIETLIVGVRMAEIMIGKREWTFNFEHLKAIHAHLFDDIYAFAGEIRYIAITKRTVFCLPQYIQQVAAEIFDKLRDYHYLRHQEHEEFVDNLAYFMAEVHALHPFRDGNTRTMRLFFYQLCYSAGWLMDLPNTVDKRLLEADIAALEGDYQPLIGILHEAIRALD